MPQSPVSSLCAATSISALETPLALLSATTGALAAADVPLREVLHLVLRAYGYDLRHLELTVTSAGRADKVVRIGRD